MWYFSYPPTPEVEALPIYLISIGKHELQPRIIKPDGNPHDQFFYNTRGNGILKIDDEEYELPEKSGFMIPAGVPHEYYPLGDVWDIRWMVPYGHALPDLYKQMNITKAQVWNIADTKPLDMIMSHMHYELIHDARYGIYSASAMVYDFIIEFKRQILRAENTKTDETESEKVYGKHIMLLKDYISYHYMQTITLQELCDIVHVSPQHLCRIFKTMTGRRPMEYILQVRIEHAKELLSDTEYTVGNISYWCGFENFNYFCKVFKEIENMTPSEYRIQYCRV